MLHFLLSIGAMVGSFYLMYYREKIGDMIGEADWMRAIGGVYNVIVIVAVLIFFWGLAELTGTTGVLFKPVLFLFGVRQSLE